jgi:hypothetical protein
MNLAAQFTNNLFFIFRVFSMAKFSKWLQLPPNLTMRILKFNYCFLWIRLVVTILIKKIRNFHILIGSDFKILNI